MMRAAYVNARLVDPATDYDGPGEVLTENGKILDAGPNLFGAAPPEGTDIVDCGGHVLSPGLIDMRVFTGEPGSEQKETLGSASIAAAAGGVTTMIVMPRTAPVIDDASLVDFIERRARDTAVVHVHPMAALTRGFDGKQMTEIGLLSEAGAVGFTDAGRSVPDAQLFRRCLSYAKTFGALIVHDALEPSLTTGGVMNEGEFATRLGLPGIPVAAETIMVQRDLALLELTGGRYHLAQVSCAATLALVANARKRGLTLTCAVSAHHLALNENDIGDYRTFCKVLPPLRCEDDRAAMVEGIRDGRIDVIVSSHEPQPPEDKRLPFGEAAFGAVGLETLLPIALELHHSSGIPLLDVLRTVTQRPAEILGLPAGRLAPGTPADLVIMDIGYPFVLREQDLRSRSKNTPFEFRRLQGRVLRTVVAGKTVFTAEGDRKNA